MDEFEYRIDEARTLAVIRHPELGERAARYFDDHPVSDGASQRTLQNTRGVVAYRGRIVGERYAPGRAREAGAAGSVACLLHARRRAVGLRVWCDSCAARPRRAPAARRLCGRRPAPGCVYGAAAGRVSAVVVATAEQPSALQARIRNWYLPPGFRPVLVQPVVFAGSGPLTVA
jgi:hypothetical protein